jgi:AhpD family alkylhydroperoxidase
MNNDDYHNFRKTMDEKIMELDSLSIKRFYAIDTDVYEDGVLPAKTKEMLGLAASMVLRCDDCIRYHLERCIELGVSLDELTEVFEIALIQGGSVVIPHLRRAMEWLRESSGK